jgi:hypothetical protein
MKKGPRMSLSINITDLAVVANGNADKKEFARRSEKAAALVQEFSEQSSLAAFEALLNGPQGNVMAAAIAAASLAREVNDQSLMVAQEVTRFLEQAPKS